MKTRDYKRGQIAMQFQLAMWIILIFITIVLAAEYAFIPSFFAKQQAEAQRIKNINKCAVIDTFATFNTTGINYTIKNAKDLNCMSTTDKQLKITGITPFEKDRQLG